MSPTKKATFFLLLRRGRGRYELVSARVQIGELEITGAGQAEVGAKWASTDFNRSWSKVMTGPGDSGAPAVGSVGFTGCGSLMG